MNLIVKTFDELSNKEVYEILKVRAKIFVKEENINYVDMDDIDYSSYHFLLIENNQIVAYLRGFYIDKSTLKLGRVLTSIHNKGYGKNLMESSLDYIKSNLNASKIVLDAQLQVIDFYKKFGFIETSDIFLEENIKHKKMELIL